MTIRRSIHDRTNSYTLISNSLIRDQDLGLEEIGLMTHLLSLPNDWVLSVSQLCKRFKCNRCVIDRLIKRLIELGYMIRVQLRKGGRYSGYEYIWAEDREALKKEVPYSGLQNTVAPNTVEQQLLNTNTKPSTKEKKESKLSSAAKSSKIFYILTRWIELLKEMESVVEKSINNIQSFKTGVKVHIGKKKVWIPEGSSVDEAIVLLQEITYLPEYAQELLRQCQPPPQCSGAPLFKWRDR